ncbi:hypothetical protein FRA_41c09810 [Francisella sp. W12-1067]|nr:hypothetical protein FRA_41c09810 [Francisella sp. W12-1067]
MEFFCLILVFCLKQSAVKKVIKKFLLVRINFEIKQKPYFCKIELKTKK